VWNRTAKDILCHLWEDVCQTLPEKWCTGEWLLHHNNAPAQLALTMPEFSSIMARLLSCTHHTNPPPHNQYPVTSFFYWNTSWHWREGHFMTSGKFMNNCRLHFKKCKQRMQQILQAIAQVCYIKNKILTRNSMTMSHIFPTKWVHVYISPPIMLHFWNQWTGSDKKPCSLAYKYLPYCIVTQPTWSQFSYSPLREPQISHIQMQFKTAIIKADRSDDVLYQINTIYNKKLN